LEYAITGIACIFPGARNVDEYWRNIVTAKVAPVTSLEKWWGIPREKYMNLADNRKSKIYMDKGFCLPEEIAGSFGKGSGRQIMASREVLRQLSDQLQADGKRTEFQNTGLVVGTSWSDQGYFDKDIELIFGSSSREPVKDIVYTPDKQLYAIAKPLGIGGPCIAVDTACASSLYALDIGMGLIKRGQADSAIIMGLNAVIPPFLYIGFSKLKALSLKGQILPFSKEASGIIIGEGVGAILIEPLEKALREGRKILGVIKSLGLSADGAERSPFAPGPQGQNLALKRAYNNIQKKVDYIEMHGTATSIGDDTELRVMGEFFDNYQNREKIPIGSVKSLIGHTLAAAGIASLIKAVLVLCERTIPPHINVEPNPLLEKTCLYLPLEPKPIEVQEREISVGVSSFGFSGANSHMVISSFSGNKHRKLYNNNSGAGADYVREPIAILDFEAHLGKESDVKSLFDLDMQLKNRFRTFPMGRFRTGRDVSCFKEEEIRGDFLNDSITIDAYGLKMGPNSLKKIDHFQALVIHVINLMLRRNKEIKDSADTSIVLCSNMSGETSVKQYRKHFLVFNRDNIKDLFIDKKMEDILWTDISFEEIASSTPAMLSGYPASHFNIRGFHQTLSGGAYTFWQAFFLAPYWLGERCRNLIIGAGHMIKSPVDILSYKEDTNNIPPIGEGFSAFILKRLSDAREDRDKILGYITAVIPGATADTFDEACKAAGFDPSSIEHKEICQLDIASIPASEEKDAISAQSLIGYMGEASGIEALSRVLYSKDKISCIQIFDKDQLIASVFLVKENEYSPNLPEIKIPVEICFQEPEKNFENHHSATSCDIGPSSAGNSDLFLELPKSMASMTYAYLAQQRKLIQLLSDSECKVKTVDTPDTTLYQENLVQGLEQYLTGLRKNPDNIVISKAVYNKKKKVYSGQLVVNEGHPYFFDHEVDHVPGFLIIEGILQLADIYVLHNLGSFSLDEIYVNSFNINFKKFCEKDSPVFVEIVRIENASQEQLVLKAAIIQCESIICTARLGIRKLNTAKMNFAYIKSDSISLANQKMVHKNNLQNVLVESLEMDWDNEKATCKAIPIQDGHILCDGCSKVNSILYLLELTRQFLAQVSHNYGIPLGAQQILLTLDINTQGPIFKDMPLIVECKKQEVTNLKDITLSNLKTTIFSDGKLVGESYFKVQAMSRETYDKLRWQNPAKVERS